MPRASAAVLVALTACSSPATPRDGGPSAWSEQLPLPEPRLEPGVTALGQRLVVAGGFDDSLTIRRDVYALDLFAQEWSVLPEAPVARTHVNLAGASATLYLLGGHEGADFLARGESFALDTDLEGATWRPIAAMPAGEERGAAGVVVSPPHIFLIGGASTTAALSSVLDYNFSTDTWTTLPPLPSPRSHAAAMRRQDGTLIVAGGLASLSSTAPLAEVWRLPPGAQAWEPGAAMPMARGGCAYGVVLGQLVCAGGEAGAAALRSVLIYDPVNDVWSTSEDLPEPRAGTQGAVIGGRLLVPGGAASLEFRPTATTYMFSLLETLDRDAVRP